VPAPITSPDEAKEMIDHFNGVMDALLGLVEVETELVRMGRLRDAAALEGKKSDLARLYLTDSARLKMSTSYLSTTVPKAMAMLRQRHDTFRSLLQLNLTVLATAHAVSEGIIRGVSDELVRKSSPQTYGASGRHSVPPPRAVAQPLTVCRMS